MNNNRDDILAALECCENDRIESCAVCAYNQHGYPFCLSRLISDVKSILDPTPKVLTLKEVEASAGDILWMEYKSWGTDLRPMNPVCVERIGQCDICDKKMEVIEFTDGMDTVADYGIRYRMWSARPTDDQRREAAWENGNLH